MNSTQQLKNTALTILAAIDREYAAIKTRQRHIHMGGGATQDDYAKFNTMCLAALERMTARSSTYYQQALREVEHHGSLTSEALSSGLYALVASVKGDVQRDAVMTFREEENARVLEEFLVAAESFASRGRLDGAVILAGGVLENHLLHLAAKHEVLSVDGVADRGEYPTHRAVNDALAQVAYGRNDQRSVEGCLEVLDQTLRGGSGKISSTGVDVFIRRIRTFVARYPA